MTQAVKQGFIKESPCNTAVYLPKAENKDKKKNYLEIEENNEEQELLEYEESVLFDKKPSLWQRIKESKLGRAVSYVLKIRVRVKIELPNALPEGRGE